MRSSTAGTAPLHEVIKADGTLSDELLAGGTIRWHEGLDCLLDYMAPSEYEVVLRVETMGALTSDSRFTYRVEEEPELAAWAAGWDDFEPQFLPGTWDLHVLGPDDKPVPQHVTYTVRAHPHGMPGWYLVDVSAANPPVQGQEHWFLDLRSVPHLRFFPLEDGREVGGHMAPVFFGVQGTQARILAKMIHLGGMVWLWVKREPLGGDFERIQPVETPEPMPLW